MSKSLQSQASNQVAQQWQGCLTWEDCEGLVGMLGARVVIYVLFTIPMAQRQAETAQGRLLNFWHLL